MKYLNTSEIITYIEDSWGAAVPNEKKRAALQKKIQRELRNRPGYDARRGYGLPANKVQSFVVSLAGYLEKNVYEGAQTYELTTIDRQLREHKKAISGEYSVEDYFSEPASPEAITALKQAVELARIRNEFPELDIEAFLHDFAAYELLKGEPEPKVYDQPTHELAELELKGRLEEAKLGILRAYTKKMF